MYIYFQHVDGIEVKQYMSIPGPIPRIGEGVHLELPEGRILKGRVQDILWRSGDAVGVWTEVRIALV